MSDVIDDEAVRDEACARWIGLSDREALGEALSPEERRFVHEHPRACTACLAEAEVWGAMESLVDAPARPLEPRPHAELGAVAPRGVGTAVRPSAATMPPRWGARRMALAAACVAAAAAAIVAVSVGARDRGAASGNGPSEAALAPPPPAAATAHEARIVLALTSGGSVAVDGRAGAVGQALVRGSVLDAREGSACLVVDPGVRACLERGSLLRVADTGAQRRLELLRGRIAVELDPQPAGTSFGITSRDGASIAIGTAFSVEVPEGTAPVVTRVLHGTVVVRSASGSEQRVVAHEQTSASDARPEALPALEEDHDRALLHVGDASPTVRHVTLPPAPAALPPAPVVHAPEASAAHAPEAPVAHAPAATTTVPAPPTSGTTPSVAAPASTPADLLVAARERRARGDLGGAAAAYRELVDRHAASPEALAALLPLGELQLGGLADAQGALVSFDRYLAHSGPLDEEASFGRVRALRALGRAADERTAIDRFVARFPESPLAPALRERRAALEPR